MITLVQLTNQFIMKWNAEDVIRLNNEFLKDSQYLQDSIEEDYELYQSIKNSLLREFPRLTLEESSEVVEVSAQTIRHIGVRGFVFLLKTFQEEYNTSGKVKTPIGNTITS